MFREQKKNKKQQQKLFHQGLIIQENNIYQFLKLKRRSIGKMKNIGILHLQSMVESLCKKKIQSKDQSRRFS